VTFGAETAEGLFRLLADWAEPGARPDLSLEPQKGAYREEEVSHLQHLSDASPSLDGCGLPRGVPELLT
jgi:hypothetical protein